MRKEQNVEVNAFFNEELFPAVIQHAKLHTNQRWVRIWEPLRHVNLIAKNPK